MPRGDNAGAPTKYTPALIKKAKDYLVNFEKYGDVVPQIAGLAGTLKVARETIYAWAEQPDKAIFSDIVREIMSEQERTLCNGGLQGTFNASITKLLLAKHGHSDKQELTGANGGALEHDVSLQVEFINIIGDDFEDTSTH